MELTRTRTVQTQHGVPSQFSVDVQHRVMAGVDARLDLDWDSEPVYKETSPGGPSASPSGVEGRPMDVAGPAPFDDAADNDTTVASPPRKRGSAPDENSRKKPAVAAGRAGRRK
jgi:hypothetical protein